MTGKIFGTFTFAAIMSAVLVKFFSQLAFAADLPPSIDPTDLAGDGQFIGQYKVTEESSASKDPGNLCASAEEKGKYGRALSCGDRIWVYQNKEEVILVSVPNRNTVTNLIMVWTIEGKKCNGFAELSEAYTKGIFHLGLCDVAQLDSDSEQLSSYKPTSPGAVLADLVLFGMLGASSHSTTLDLSQSNTTIEVEDIYKGQGIDNKMILKKTAPQSVSTHE